MNVDGILDYVRELPLKEIASEPYEIRGILHSEMAFVIGACKYHKATTIIESGRARGQSTYMLCKYLPEIKVISIERGSKGGDEETAKKRLEGFKNVELLQGDGPGKMEEYKKNGLEFLALLDGPKHSRALGPLKKLGVPGFIHDMFKGNEGRKQWKDFYSDAWFTDDENYLKEFSWLDDIIKEKYGHLWVPYAYNKTHKIGSYGGTIGYFTC